MAFTALLAFAALVSTSIALPQTADSSFLCADGVNRVANAQCCSWFKVRDDLINDVFEGICGENAHSTIRIAFHDAAGFSLTQNFGGGADGSIIAFQDSELTFAANAGIDDIVADLQPFADAHHISYGDVIQFGSSVALSLCPGAPKVQTFVGRLNATQAAPDGTLPKPEDKIDDIFARMADAGFSPAELVALLASHTVAGQDQIQPTIHGSPFDSSPGHFDSQLFLEVMLKGTVHPGGLALATGEVQSPIPGEFRLQSDLVISRDPRTACTWQSFAADATLMSSKFSAAMAKLALLGQNPKHLTDCTEVIQNSPGKVSKTALLPPGFSPKDLVISCQASALPVLATRGGAATAIPPVPTQ